MNAADVKTALRRRHPAWSQGVIGEWTCIEEWHGVDLLAVSAWRSGKVIGYEVKVSRSDLRRELLHPDKRAVAVARCHEFYLAVPDGIYRGGEATWEEPEWPEGAWDRERCPGVPPAGALVARARWSGDTDRYAYGGQCAKRLGDDGGRRTHRIKVPVPVDYATVEPYGVTDRALRDQTPDAWVTRQMGEHSGSRRRHTTYATCPACGGKGHAELSLVERTAPTVWVPADVGLVVVTTRGCRVVRKAPRRDPDKPLVPKGMGQLVRWASVRPDPRHHPPADPQLTLLEAS